MHCLLCSCVHLWLPSVVSLGGGTEDSCCNGWALPSCPICYHIVYHWLHVLDSISWWQQCRGLHIVFCPWLYLHLMDCLNDVSSHLGQAIEDFQHPGDIPYRREALHCVPQLEPVSSREPWVALSVLTCNQRWRQSSGRVSKYALECGHLLSPPIECDILA